MPRPPPPAAAFTSSGKPISSRLPCLEHRHAGLARDPLRLELVAAAPQRVRRSARPRRARPPRPRPRTPRSRRGSRSRDGRRRRPPRARPARARRRRGRPAISRVSSAERACSEPRSSGGATATVAMPSSRQVRKTRSAISPRLATSSLRTATGGAYGRGLISRSSRIQCEPLMRCCDLRCDQPGRSEVLPRVREPLLRPGARAVARRTPPGAVLRRMRDRAGADHRPPPHRRRARTGRPRRSGASSPSCSPTSSASRRSPRSATRRRSASSCRATSTGAARSSTATAAPSRSSSATPSWRSGARRSRTRTTPSAPSAPPWTSSKPSRAR